MEKSDEIDVKVTDSNLSKNEDTNNDSTLIENIRSLSLQDEAKDEVFDNDQKENNKDETKENILRVSAQAQELEGTIIPHSAMGMAKSTDATAEETSKVEKKPEFSQFKMQSLIDVPDFAFVTLDGGFQGGFFWLDRNILAEAN